jgi:hypothetical protein
MRIPQLSRFRRAAPPPLYLVSTAGHPNYGDELIARAWLDFLAEKHPDRDVWLDCPHPGRAAHLFAGSHPRVRFTNTLWEMAFASETHDPVTDAPRIARLIRELGSPRYDPGLLALRGVASIHLLGGGYLNGMWQDNLGLVAALAEFHRAFGMPVFATGQGLMPAEEGHRAWLREQIAEFDVFEVRDDESAAFADVPRGLDDAFLALAVERNAFEDPAAAPSKMVLVQGDLRAWDDDAAVASIRSFVSEGEDVGVVEAIPPDDVRYLGDVPGRCEVYPFGRIWVDGLPAREGQAWLTTRFHIHLMAAAAGAAGTVLAGREGYYDVKHRSLLDLGTGWRVVPAGTDVSDEANRPTVDPGFPAKARELAARKRALAARIHP